MTTPAVRTVADLADVMGLTEIDDLRLLHDLAKQGTVGPAALCTRFHLVKRLRAEAPQWTLPDHPYIHFTTDEPPHRTERIIRRGV